MKDKRKMKITEQAFTNAMDHLHILMESSANLTPKYTECESGVYFTNLWQAYWCAYQAVGAAFCEEMDKLEGKKPE